MTNYRILIALVMVSLHVFHFPGSAQTPVIQAPAGSPSAQAPGTSPSAQVIDCEEACGYRCHLSSRQHLCMRACGTCCERCQCVPPGTYGHYEVCPCYANMTTHGGRRKCP